MNSKTLLATVVRVGAIIIVICMIEKMPLDFRTYQTDGSFDWYQFIGFVLLPNLIILFIAILMWVNPNLLIGNIDDEESPSPGQTDVSELGSLLIAILGLFIIAFSFADLVYHITLIKLTKSFAGVDFEFTPNQIGLLVSTIVEIIIGFLLIFGRKVSVVLISQFNKEFKSGL